MKRMLSHAWLLVAAAALCGGGGSAEVKTELPASLFEDDVLEQPLEAPEDGFYDFIWEGELSRTDDGSVGTIQVKMDGEAIPWTRDFDPTPKTPSSWHIYERVFLAAGTHVFQVIATTVAYETDFDDPEGWSARPVPSLVEAMHLSPAAKKRGGEVWVGGPEPGYADGQGTEARFGAHFVAAPDGEGGFWVGDSDCHRLRQVSAGRRVRTIAGTGQAGDADGPAEEAEFRTFSCVGTAADGGCWMVEYWPAEWGWVSDDGGKTWHWLSPEWRVRRLTLEGKIQTRWSGQVASGLPITISGEWYGETYGQPIYRFEAVAATQTDALLLYGSYWGCTRLPTENCGGGWEGHYPCGERYECFTVHNLLLLEPNGDLTQTGEHWTDLSLTNAAGVRFFSVKDQLLRQPPGGHPQTIYRNEELRAVVHVEDEDVWVVEGPRIVHVPPADSPVCTLRVETTGGGEVQPDYSLWPIFQRGTELSLAAIPKGNARFIGWSGAVTSTNPVLRITMEQDTALQAHFGYPLTVQVTDGEARLIPDRPLYEYNQKVLVRVTPAPSLNAVLWRDGVNGLERTITMQDARSLEAVAYQKSARMSPGLFVTVSPPSAGSIARKLYPPPQVNKPIWLSVRAFPGFQFRQWSDGNPHPDRIAYLPAQPQTLTAEFDVAPEAIPRLTVRPLNEDGYLPIVIRGVPGLYYHLERSHDLREWRTVLDHKMASTGRWELNLWPGRPISFFRATMTGK